MRQSITGRGNLLLPVVGKQKRRGHAINIWPAGGRERPVGNSGEAGAASTASIPI